VGGYYLHSKVKYDYLSFYNGFPVLGGLYGTTSQKFNQKENTIAAFGQATWHMSDRLQFNLAWPSDHRQEDRQLSRSSCSTISAGRPIWSPC
jgi:hypothetical protein